MERIPTCEDVDALLRRIAPAGDPIAMARLAAAVRELVRERDQLIRERDQLLEERNGMANRLTRGPLPGPIGSAHVHSLS